MPKYVAKPQPRVVPSPAPQPATTPPAKKGPPPRPPRKERPVVVGVPTPPPRVHLPMLEAADKAVEENTPPPGYDPMYPPMACVTCTIGEVCPKYNPLYVCAYNDNFERVSTDAVGLDAALREVYADTFARYRFARLQERVAGGGFIDPNVTRLGKDVIDQARALEEWRQQKQRVTVEIRAEGPNAGRTGGSLLKSLFGPPTPAAPLPQPSVVAEAQGEESVSVKVTREGGSGDASN